MSQNPDERRERFHAIAIGAAAPLVRDVEGNGLSVDEDGQLNAEVTDGGGTGEIEVQDSGTALGPASTFNFRQNHTAQVSGGVATIDGTGGGSIGETAYAFHDIDEYGGDPTGATTSDSAFDQAVAAADPGDVIAMTNGNYWFDDTHWIEKPLTIFGRGSELRATGVPYTGAYTSTFAFRAPAWNGSFQTPNTTLSSGASAGDQAISLGSTSGLSEGDGIVFGERKDTNESSLLWGGSNRNVESDHATVRHISGNTVYLDRGLTFSYTSSSGAWFVGDMSGCRFVEMHVADGGGEDESERYFSFFFCRESLMDQCVAEENVGHAFQDFYGLRNVLRDCQFYNPILPTRASSHWEVFRMLGSTEISLVRPTAQRARRTIDMMSGAAPVRIWDPNILNAYLQGISPHSGPDGDVRNQFEIHGGVIEAEEQRPDHDKAGSGTAVAITGQTRNSKVIGTRIRGHPAIQRYFDASPINVTFHNCEIRGYQSTVISIDTGTNIWFSNNFIGGSVSLTNINRLWLRGNRITGSASTSGSSGETTPNL